MSHGKAAARDILRGRQGGRWAEDGAGYLLDELAATREAHLRRHTDTPCDQADIDSGKAPRCPWCHPELNDTVLAGPGAQRPNTDEGWIARARMAAAKDAAGGALTDLEAEALHMHPAPARIAIGGYR